MFKSDKPWVMIILAAITCGSLVILAGLSIGSCYMDFAFKVGG